MDTGLDYPSLTLSDEEVASLARGQQLRRSREAPDDGLLRISDQNGRLVAIARADRGTIKPEKVFVSAAG